MSEMECPLCGKKVKSRDYRFHRQSEEIILDVIKKNHPQWVGEDRTYPKWLTTYKSMFCPN